MSKDNSQEIYDKMVNSMGEEKVHSVLDSILDIMCMSGDHKALTMKAYNEIKKMLQDVMETYLMPNLNDEKMTEKCYTLMMALKEQTKNIIDDFKEGED